MMRNSAIISYIHLMKPKIIVLLATTGVIPFIYAGGKDPIDIVLFLIIGFISAGGAMAFNSIIDRDIDQLMVRTMKRASVSGKLSISTILMVSIALMFIAVVLAFLRFNPLTAGFVFFGEAFYILGYSLFLKRKNVLNTLIGGLGSPAPVLVGFAAATGTVPTYGWIIAGLVFIWTPSHTWALSTYYVDDYKRAGVPMLPVVYGISLTAKATFVFMIITSIYSLFMLTFPGFNKIVAILWGSTNAGFLYYGYLFLKTKDKNVAYRLFKVHNYWLASQFLLLFV